MSDPRMKTRAEFEELLSDALLLETQELAAKCGYDTTGYPGWGVVITRARDLAKEVAAKTPEYEEENR